jgi:Tfp pilus assembly protein PilN
MIKINLLDSVTERNGGAVIAVERKFSSPKTRLIMMSVSVAVLLLAVIGWDIISTNMAKAQAEAELQEQKQIEQELASVTKEMKDLEAKIQNIDLRIEAIKKLRASQAGPSAVLEAMRERIAMTPGIYLQSIDQTGEQLTIKGDSPDESAVTQFGRSLEFSSGLFTNLNIETQRREAPNQVATPAGQEAPPKAEIVGFTIRCAYTPSKANSSLNSSATSASNASGQTASPTANQPSNNPAPPQVAKN